MSTDPSLLTPMRKPAIEKRAIRQAFERAVPAYDKHAFLQQEVARRLAEHLDEMKVNPTMILDAGCGTGFGMPLLRGRFPKAHLVGLDLAHSMVAQARKLHGNQPRLQALLAHFLPRAAGLSALCADVESLPLRRDSIDMAWSSLTLQWTDLSQTFAEMNRVLKPGGLFLFATLGPDTLMELRAASQSVDRYVHVNQFIDMHDVGDALVHAGFANPVMEMERITLTYSELRELFADLKGIGAHTVLGGRRAGLMGKQAWSVLAQRYESYRQAGRLPATYEVIYGHAWAGEQAKLSDGRQVIQFRKRP
jgi:malonyl-CoA O-methyltransferase